MIITVVGMITGQIHTPSGIVGKIPSITPTFGAALKHLKIQANYLLSQFLIILTFFY